MKTDNNDNTRVDVIKIDKPHNRIIFGAPGTGKSHLLEEDRTTYFKDDYERVTFHPNYSYAQFVGTYKPVKATNNAFYENSEIENTIKILSDKTKSAQERYDLLYDDFKNKDLTRLPILVGLYSNSDEKFNTKKKDGTPAKNDNDVERNHGRAIRQYVNLKTDNISSSEITYEYVPGPFIKTWIRAYKSSQPQLLLIEEINRANVAAVFGDVFQLLDRDENGNSEYPITISEDLKRYLSEKEKINVETISIPANMYIWATMNSADQGVLPMDAAFKRRWDFEYIGIDDNEGEIEKIKIPVSLDGKKSVLWNDFRKKLNEKLSDELKINEDKLLGPFFLSKKSLENAMAEPERFVKLFESKVIMYLFEDVVKMQPAKLFNCSKLRYSEICKEFEEKGMDVFGIEVEVFDM